MKRLGQVVNALTSSPRHSDEGARKKSPGIKKDASRERLKKQEEEAQSLQQKMTNRRGGVIPDPRVRHSMLSRPSLYDKGILKFQ